MARTCCGSSMPQLLGMVTPNFIVSSHAWQPNGEVSVVATLGGGPNGAALGPDGRCYVCNNGGFEWHRRGDTVVPGLQGSDYQGGSIQAVDLATGAVETLYTHSDQGPLRGP